MIQRVEMSHEEKVKMYNKLTKKELIAMLIQTNLHLDQKHPSIKYVDPINYPIQTYSDICSCNPKNGGSGICGCSIGGQILYPNNTEYVTTTLGNTPLKLTQTEFKTTFMTKDESKE